MKDTSQITFHKPLVDNSLEPMTFPAGLREAVIPNSADTRGGSRETHLGQFSKGPSCAKASFNKFQRTEIIYSIFLTVIAVNIQIRNKG